MNKLHLNNEYIFNCHNDILKPKIKLMSIITKTVVLWALCRFTAVNLYFHNFIEAKTFQC